MQSILGGHPALRQGGGVRGRAGGGLRARRGGRRADAFPDAGRRRADGRGGAGGDLPLARGATGGSGSGRRGGGAVQVTMNISTPDAEGFRRSQSQDRGRDEPGDPARAAATSEGEDDELPRGRFPGALSVGSSGGPERRTEIVTLSNGFEERNSPWAHSRRRYDAGLGVRSLDDLSRGGRLLRGAARAALRLPLEGLDGLQVVRALGDAAALDQRIGTGDGARTVFELSKTYASGAQAYARPIASRWRHGAGGGRRRGAGAAAATSRSITRPGW